MPADPYAPTAPVWDQIRKLTGSFGSTGLVLADTLQRQVQGSRPPPAPTLEDPLIMRARMTEYARQQQKSIRKQTFLTGPAGVPLLPSTLPTGAFE